MLVCDEGVDAAIVAALRAAAVDVVWVAQAAPGATDDEVLALANGCGAIVVTADKDFGELVHRQRPAQADFVLSPSRDAAAA